MKIHLSLLLFLATALTAIIGATVLRQHHQNPPAPVGTTQEFDVKGQILSVEPDGQTVRIAHQEITGFMPAMEMPFTVKDPRLLKGLAAGDTVRFRLEVTKDDSWLTRIEKLGAGQGPTAPDQVPTATAPHAETGQAVPDFALLDQDGHPFHLRDFHGKAVVLTFIYTRCPLPNFCPLMSKNFADLQERFAKDSPGKVQLLSISFDPRFDTPEVLKRYAAAFRHDGQNWTFATGTSAQIDFVTSLFGLYREPANGFITHDLRTALIGPDGRLVHVWRSNVWTPYEVQRLTRETLQHPFAAGANQNARSSS